jgi:hypothetical protein
MTIGLPFDYQRVGIMRAALLPPILRNSRPPPASLARCFLQVIHRIELALARSHAVLGESDAAEPHYAFIKA